MPKPLREKTFQHSEPVKVSICCVTYNHAQFIEECLDGFLDQEADFRIEVVVHDDTSTDGTVEILQSYASRFPTVIRLILQTENQFSKGVCPWYAYVFPNCKGDYIALCDGDDFWSDRSKLSRQVEVLDTDKNTVITYGPVQAISNCADVSGYVGGVQRDLTPYELKLAPKINTLTVCFRNIFKGVSPPIFLRNSPVADLTIWAILGYHGGGRYIKDLPKANYRIHSGGILSMTPKERAWFMSAVARVNVAAFHAEYGDIEASKETLMGAVTALNQTKICYFVDSESPFRSVLRIFKFWVLAKFRGLQ